MCCREQLKDTNLGQIGPGLHFEENENECFRSSEETSLKQGDQLGGPCRDPGRDDVASSKSNASETREGEGAEMTSMENEEDLQSTDWKGGRGKSYRGSPRSWSGSWVKEGAAHWVGVQEASRQHVWGWGTCSVWACHVCRFRAESKGCIRGRHLGAISRLV